jgi:hypothetical protein
LSIGDCREPKNRNSKFEIRYSQKTLLPPDTAGFRISSFEFRQWGRSSCPIRTAPRQAYPLDGIDHAVHFFGVERGGRVRVHGLVSHSPDLPEKGYLFRGESAVLLEPRQQVLDRILHIEPHTPVEPLGRVPQQRSYSSPPIMAASLGCSSASIRPNSRGP